MLIATMTASEYVLIITAIFTGICSVIAAIKSTKVAEVSKTNKEKLDTIHKLTNGNLSDVKSKLETETNRNEYLQALIFELLDGLPPETLDKIKIKMRGRSTEGNQRTRKDDYIL